MTKVHEAQTMLKEAEMLLMEYAAGTLSDSYNLFMASYIALCPDAQRMVRQCEALGGVIMEQICEPVAMEDHSLQAVLDQLEDRTADNEAPPGKMRQEEKTEEEGSFAFLPDPLCAYLTEQALTPRWASFYPGLEICRIPTECPQTRLQIVKAGPGRKVPSHSHKGFEITLVLEGAYADEDVLYSAGDLIVLDETVHHQPIAHAEEGCISLVMTDAPVHFTGPLARLLNFLQGR